MDDIFLFFEEQEKALRKMSVPMVQVLCDKLKAGLVNNQSQATFSAPAAYGHSLEAVDFGYTIALGVFDSLVGQLIAQLNSDD